MDRFLSTSKIIISLLIVLQSCSYNDRTSSSSKIYRARESSVVERQNIFSRTIDSHRQKIKSNRFYCCYYSSEKTSSAVTVNKFQQLATELLENFFKNNLNDVFSDIPTHLERRNSQRLTDTAKILAGMNVSDRSEFANFKQLKSWQRHRQFLNSAWSQLESQQLMYMKNWQATELNTLKNFESTIFYPFSNANLLEAYTLFPQSKVFILTGIEPPGKIPDLSKLSGTKFAKELIHLSYNLSEILSSDYFRPPQIINLFKQEAISALYVFLVRTNNRIYDVEYISLDEKAKICSPQPGMISGVKITFTTEGDTERKILYYFSSKLSNEALAETPELAAFVNRHDRKITYLNDAAYLAHFDSFSQIKNFILANSNYILQDDSGLPLTVFKSEKWNLRFYGNYTQPVERFSDRYQTQLWQVYNSKNNIHPLNFATGYQLEAKNSNLMLAMKKNISNNHSP